MAGRFRQSFPHGRTKTVAVEVKKKRTYTQGVGGKMTEVPSEAEQKLALRRPHRLIRDRRSPHHTLTEHERVARLKALEQAKRDEDVRKQFEEEEAKRVAERTEREKAEIDKRRREEDERKAAEEATKVRPRDRSLGRRGAHREGRRHRPGAYRQDASQQGGHRQAGGDRG